MKIIGLIGGMSWESSLEYYRIINETVKMKLGGLHSAKCILYSVNFEEIEHLQQTAQWEAAALILISASQSLERAGADFIVLCTNTMHKLADHIQAQISIPFLHIADATAQKIKAAGFSTIGLLGTRFTMEQDFYSRRLVDAHGLKVIIPDEPDRQIVHRIIYDELCMGIIRVESREKYIAIMNKLIEKGAEGIILGCTEIELLVRKGDCPVMLFPTTWIHATAAVEYALDG
ncbi:MAG: aspartate/glutamate racemase family protein [Anaerolineales bacterium]|nr:aspartate/glutamate racemase family protein [Anaerolineales bacterium]